MRKSLFWLQLVALYAACGLLAADDAPVIAKFSVDQPAIQLHGRDATWQILVDGLTADQQHIDLTRTARYRSLTPKTVEVNDRGIVRSLGDGVGSIELVVGTLRQEVQVKVSGSADHRSLSFQNDIIPILNRFGCNGSGCHGKAEGQNGFKLSVFGFDPRGDYQSLTMEGRGRRVFPAAPERSLLLQKISGISPHGGGVRIEKRRPEYRVLRDWIAAGLPLGSDDDPRIAKIEITPQQHRMEMGRTQQVRVVATYDNGLQRDVTELAQFQSNNDALASVSESGLVTLGESPGLVAVMATYVGNVDVFRITIPRRDVIANYPQLAKHNFVDESINRQVRQLGIVPSGGCSDADFLRRVYLDIIGTLPTPAEARTFLTNESSGKRKKLVDQLLERPEYADYWALKWSDLLRVNRRELGHKAAYDYYRWIRDSFAANKPLDEFTRDLVAANGLLADVPAGQFFKVVKKPNEMASITSQVFLGVRIECAQCHHHPWDRWSQADYQGMQAFFTQVAFKASPRGEGLVSTAKRRTTHPRTGDTIFAYPLGDQMPEASPEGDRRKLLAAWMTAADNPWFARNIANRMWEHFMGRGIVEPVDDFRLTNPPSNPELLDALAGHLIESGFDAHQLIRAITSSAAYQRTANVNDTNQQDEQNYSRFFWKQIEAEVLFDAVCQTTGVDEKFRGVPAGSRAIQLWDSEVPHYFLKLFGRPVRVTACDCERVSEPTVGQVLHVLNSPEIHAKLSHEAGNIARLAEQYSDDQYLVEELYLTFFARFPSDKERKTMLQYLSRADDRRRAVEDIAWTMMNSIEFLFNH